MTPDEPSRPARPGELCSCGRPAVRVVELTNPDLAAYLGKRTVATCGQTLAQINRQTIFSKGSGRVFPKL